MGTQPETCFHPQASTVTLCDLDPIAQALLASQQWSIITGHQATAGDDLYSPGDGTSGHVITTPTEGDEFQITTPDADHKWWRAEYTYLRRARPRTAGQRMCITYTLTTATSCREAMTITRDQARMYFANPEAPTREEINAARHQLPPEALSTYENQITATGISDAPDIAVRH